MESGGYSCTGVDNLNQPDAKIWFVKLDSEGNILWQNSYFHPDHDNDLGIVVNQTENGQYLIGCTGTYIDSNSNQANAPMLLKTDSRGELLWMRDYHEETNCGSIAWDGLELTSDDNYIVCGWTDEVFDIFGRTIVSPDAFMFKIQGETNDIDDVYNLPAEYS